MSQHGARPWLRAVAVTVALAFGVPWTALAIAALLVDVPAELDAPPPGSGTDRANADSARQTSVRVLDREGGLLAEVHDGAGDEARWIALVDAPRVAAAIVAAEDRRFRWHLGVDPLRTARAAIDGLRAGRVVSGASTLTQQLARVTVAAPRTMTGKAHAVALAARLEVRFSKDAILEQYLNRAPFGARVRGVEAASRRFFDKPASALSLAEAATLAALPQSPARLDPRREAGRARLLRRRDAILDRMQGSGLATRDEVARARAEPLVLAPRFLGVAAPHFARAVLAGTVDPCAPRASPARDGVVAIETTIDPVLQAAAVEATRRTVADIEDRHATSAAAVVLDNATGDILAWVGSPGLDDSRLGHNDGVLALRQPGSALKPFVYELAIERLGFSPATRLPDVELSFPARDGEYRPRNYDGTFHGPVLLRAALGNSYNVPAVWTAQRLGAAPLVRRLRDLGLCSVSRGAEHYGLALALGDAEITLLELASAYATLARGGELLPPRAVTRVVSWDGAAEETAVPPPRRVLDHDASALVLDVLADPGARVASFGERSVLTLPFPFAAKTGTSKGFRDNVAVGSTPERTVAVWVGNMDGSPMREVSGVTGAGPLLRAIALASASPAPGAFVTPAETEQASICTLSGQRAGSQCAHARTEHVPRGGAASGTCDVHLAIAVDAEGALADMTCAGTERRVVEVWTAPFAAWARGVGRPLLPSRISSRCPPPPEAPERRAFDAVQAPRITFPADGDRFHVDPGATAEPAIEIVVEGHAIALELDGAPLAFKQASGHHSGHHSGQLRARWALRAGPHRLVTRGGEGSRSHSVSFAVE